MHMHTFTLIIEYFSVHLIKRNQELKEYIAKHKKDYGTYDSSIGIQQENV